MRGFHDAVDGARCKAIRLLNGSLLGRNGGDALQRPLRFRILYKARVAVLLVAQNQGCEFALALFAARCENDSPHGLRCWYTRRKPSDARPFYGIDDDETQKEA